MPTPSSREIRGRPWGFARAFYIPQPNRSSIIFSCFARYVFLCFLGDIWVLRDSVFLAKKTHLTVWQGMQNACATFQGLSPENGSGIWTFVRSYGLWSIPFFEGHNPWMRSAWKKIGSCRDYLVSVKIQLWALNMTSDWTYAVSSLDVCAENCTNMPWSAPGSGSFRK